MPLLAKKSVLAAKIETTPGTAIGLAVGDAAFNVFDLRMQPNIAYEERPGQSALSPRQGSLAARSGTCTFWVELTGDATTAPTWMSTFLPACGWVDVTKTFGPVSEGPGNNVKTLTIGANVNGVMKQLRGCAGTAQFVFAAGQKVRINFTFTGIWDPPTDVALLAPTYPTTAPLRFASSGLTVGGYAYIVANVTIDLGNEVVMREYSGDVSGYASALIIDRSVVGTMDPESTLIATKDTAGDWLAGTEAALSIVLGTAGNKITFAAPKLQITNIQGGERNGIEIDSLEFVCNRSADAGDDQFTITHA